MTDDPIGQRDDLNHRFRYHPPKEGQPELINWDGCTCSWCGQPETRESRAFWYEDISPAPRDDPGSAVVYHPPGLGPLCDDACEEERAAAGTCRHMTEG